MENKEKTYQVSWEEHYLVEVSTEETDKNEIMKLAFEQVRESKMFSSTINNEVVVTYKTPNNN